MSASPDPVVSPQSSDPGEFSDVVALQNALLAEHAAVYGYGFVGANSTDAARELCYAHLDAHRAQRDTLRAELLERGAEPPAAAAAYRLPTETDAETLSGFAVRLEEQTAQAYLELAGAGSPDLRDLAGRSLQSATLRSLAWGAGLPAFPGYPGGEP
ncbi:ferritin-like domain-containing protein [Marinactinospora rubrisoli]|uniref:Ferritin-like domain-containing protein n=1 Tax=Marinactinospora rubrisoli TaxID=2715399 RepID=A0ABW2KJH3_9ACTN